MEWQPIYAELANKIRWAVQSTSASAGINYSYQEAMAAANYASGDLLRMMQAKYEAPDLRLRNVTAVKDFVDRDSLN